MASRNHHMGIDMDAVYNAAPRPKSSRANSQLGHSNNRSPKRNTMVFPVELLAMICRYLVPRPAAPDLEEKISGSDYWDAEELFDDNNVLVIWKPHQGSNADLYHLACTCRSLRDVALPLLYEVVTTKGNRALKIFLNTIAKRPHLRRQVRRLCVLDMERGGPHGSGVLKLLGDDRVFFPQLHTLRLEVAKDSLCRRGFVAEFFDVGAKYSKLRRLFLRRFGDMTRPGPIALLWPQLKYVSEFYLHEFYADEGDHSDNWRILDLLPRTKVLMMSDNDITHMNWDIDGASSTRVETLVTCCNEQFMTWFSFPNLKHLKTQDYFHPEFAGYFPHLESFQALPLYVWEAQCEQGGFLGREGIYSLIDCLQDLPHFKIAQVASVHPREVKKFTRDRWVTALAELRQLAKDHGVELRGGALPPPEEESEEPEEPPAGNSHGGTGGEGGNRSEPGAGEMEIEVPHHHAASCGAQQGESDSDMDDVGGWQEHEPEFVD